MTAQLLRWLCCGLLPSLMRQFNCDLYTNFATAALAENGTKAQLGASPDELGAPSLSSSGLFPRVAP
jgi:hypothetical protein